MKFTFEAWGNDDIMDADAAAEHLEFIAGQVREGYLSGDAGGAGWWSVEGLEERT